ncbi:hypothetical protein PPERSA_01527 [Pseudocohnilembus persalinus]|uniref:C3H1-type domain-containing protein n=1 Tax=Pseudocohnilembus persalinus TaxID=266149 RepID=A0A0V0R7R1_PSEPJ|nr:hypothetical protein PPERSA_01527 [Pseudocohnilembus persalinus]|eukprot:KRX10515.1 hypothetical protein PPERSA_01527 [Pseudocohnilembus persalinus]
MSHKKKKPLNSNSDIFIHNTIQQNFQNNQQQNSNFFPQNLQPNSNQNQFDFSMQNFTQTQQNPQNQQQQSQFQNPQNIDFFQNFMNQNKRQDQENLQHPMQNGQQNYFQNNHFSSNLQQQQSSSSQSKMSCSMMLNSESQGQKNQLNFLQQNQQNSFLNQPQFQSANSLNGNQGNLNHMQNNNINNNTLNLPPGNFNQNMMNSAQNQNQLMNSQNIFVPKNNSNQSNNQQIQNTNINNNSSNFNNNLLQPQQQNQNININTNNNNNNNNNGQNFVLSNNQQPAASFMSKSHRLGEQILAEQTDVTHSSIRTEKMHGNNYQDELVIEQLDLINFKNQPCKITTQHNHKHCPYYHNAKDRKRPGTFYSTDLCEYIEKNENCPFFINCPKSHNRVEQLYQPDKYKTKFCTFYPNKVSQCDYGNFCSFAHSEQEIVIELIHNYQYDSDFYMFYFKTVWCPFNLTTHDKALCVYAHNWQDYRRKPHLYEIEPQPCENWKANGFILNYENGCPNGFNCNKCHGWKELEYHPKNYKTKPCQKNCSKNKDCPNFHTQSERRLLSSGVQKSIFRMVPKNRITTNTFKTRAQIASQNMDLAQFIQFQMNSQYLPQQQQQMPKQQIMSNFNQNQSQTLHIHQPNNNQIVIFPKDNNHNSKSGSQILQNSQNLIDSNSNSGNNMAYQSESVNEFNFDKNKWLLEDDEEKVTINKDKQVGSDSENFEQKNNNSNNNNSSSGGNNTFQSQNFNQQLNSSQTLTVPNQNLQGSQFSPSGYTKGKTFLENDLIQETEDEENFSEKKKPKPKKTNQNGFLQNLNNDNRIDFPSINNQNDLNNNINNNSDNSINLQSFINQTFQDVLNFSDSNKNKSKIINNEQNIENMFNQINEVGEDDDNLSNNRQSKQSQNQDEFKNNVLNLINDEENEKCEQNLKE